MFRCGRELMTSSGVYMSDADIDLVTFVCCHIQIYGEMIVITTLSTLDNKV